MIVCVLTELSVPSLYPIHLGMAGAEGWSVFLGQSARVSPISLSLTTISLKNVVHFDARTRRWLDAFSRSFFLPWRCFGISLGW